MITQPEFAKFESLVERLASRRKPKIGFGLTRKDDEILSSLERSKSYADICIVGPKEIEGIQGFEVVTDVNPEERLARMLHEGEVEGIVRGTIDDFKTKEAFERLSGQTAGDDLSLLADPIGRRFFASPVSNPQGWSKEERLSMAEAYVEFSHKWSIVPRVAVFTGERHDTYKRKKEIREGVVGKLNETYEDAEWIVSRIMKKGVDAKNWSIDSDLAVKDGYNILIPVNGMVGNQMFRMLLLSGGKILFASYAKFTTPYEDNSRNEKDFDFHIKWLVVNINKKREE